MDFCECNSGKYRWRDVAKINGKYYKVDEEVNLCEGESLEDPDSTFDICPIFDKLTSKYGIDRDDVELASFEPWGKNSKIVDEMLNGAELGAYCPICGGDI